MHELCTLSIGAEIALDSGLALQLPPNHCPRTGPAVTKQLYGFLPQNAAINRGFFVLPVGW